MAGSKTSKAKALTKVQKSQVKALVEGEAETKRSHWYSTFQNGLVAPTAPLPGVFEGSGWQVKNNTILSNYSDILRVIPEVGQGTDKYERLGIKIKPQSLLVKGTVRINANQIYSTGLPVNLKVYIYVLQHVRLKSYDDLFANNKFSQLLDTGDGFTQSFNGNPVDGELPVAKQNYKLLQRKEVILRYGGGKNVSEGASGIAFNNPANSHTWYADFSINLSKNLPATFTYPDTFASGSPSLADPTNSSIFMAVGYVDWNNPDPTQATGTSLPNYSQSRVSNSVVESAIQLTYMSMLTYKDM